MKKLYYLIILIVILGLVLTGCLLSNVGQVPTNEQSGVTYLTKAILLPDGLAGLWHFDESGGTTASDSSGSGNTGTLVNGPLWVTGNFDNALSFDGSNDYVRVLNSASLDVTDYTFELWLNAVDFAQVYPTLLNRRVQSQTVGYYWVWIKSDRIVLTYTNGTAAQSQHWVTSFSAGEWYHIALTKSGSSFTMYKNGSSLGTKSLTYADTVGGNLFIGTYQGAAGNKPFNGLIDEVRIWDGALTTDQIADSYNSGIVLKKQMSAYEAWLGDHITMTLEVATATAVTVVDTLPAELSYIPGTFMVDGVLATPIVVGQVISYDLSPCAYTITFDTQVTSVEATPNTVTNYATAGVASASAELTIHPYEGFTKVADGDMTVEVGEEIIWNVTITVTNIPGDEIALMSNIVVQDRFGGELEIDEFAVTSGTKEIKLSGKTEKPKIKWYGFSLLDGVLETADLIVSTDVNPGGHHSYSTAGDYEMNSGAVLKFIDSEGTSFQLSAHTPQIDVEVTEPE